LRDYRSNLQAHLLPASAIRLWSRSRGHRSKLGAPRLPLSAHTKNKLLVVMRGVFRRAQHVWGFPSNPVATVEKYRQRSSVDIDVFSPEEVLALVRAAASEQDAAIYLVAAFTGLRRGEVLALRWRDVDFGGSIIRVRSSYAAGQLSTPKSGKGPLGPNGARHCGGACAAWRAPRLGRGRRSRVPPARPAPTWMDRPCVAATGRRWRAQACGRFAFTACATRSGRG
jgi:integrase